MSHTNHTIINGDCRQMNLLADKSVQLIVTSPPYWQLKDYGTTDQIGFNDSYQDYINHLNLVWKECHRVLQDGCRLCINIGDQFARSVYYGRYKVIPIHSEIIRFCETIGFDFMGQIIWQKTTTTNTTGGGAVMGSYPYPRNGIVKLDFEYILLFKKQGKAPQPTKEQKEEAALTNEEWNTFFNGHWYFNGARQDKHIAMFPVELPYRLIKMFSFPQETVLDPFMGSGTTALAARKLGRNSVGYEINPEFIPIIKEKIGANELMDTVNVNTKKDVMDNMQSCLDSLPYKFVDVHKIDKKIDVKALQFGSKLDAQSTGKREETYSLKEVITPELIKLSNGVVVRLIGIKTNPEKEGQSIDYLYHTLKGKRVYMRYDSTMYDDDNHLYAYVYLSNRTFVNAHMIKDGMALVDNSIDYKYKSKFNSL